MKILRDRQESWFESQLLNRGITEQQQNTKMENLRNLAIRGFRLIKMIEHGKYVIKPLPGFYNPYTNEWTDPHVAEFEGSQKSPGVKALKKYPE